MDGLEAVADAIMHYEGWMPGSRSNRNRNPGNLRSSHLKIGEDPQGYAIFHSLPNGYEALLQDLEAKFTGHTVTGLKPDSTVLQLFEDYAPSSDHNYPQRYAEFVAEWVSRALNRTVSTATRLQDIWTPAG